MASRGADLAVEAIHTAYGLSQVLFGVSLEVHAGECIALIGRNGVGKTTTMRSIIGLTPPASGRVMWKGRDIARLGPREGTHIIFASQQVRSGSIEEVVAVQLAVRRERIQQSQTDRGAIGHGHGDGPVQLDDR